MSLRQRNFEILEYDSRQMALEELIAIFPQKIYKYIPINKNAFSSLENGELWFSSPSSFNDPFDCKLNLSFGEDEKVIKNNVEKFISSGSHNLMEDEELQNILRDPIRSGFVLNVFFKHAIDQAIGVSCFSEVDDSPLMWAHYSSSHTGICLEFDLSDSGFIRDNLIPVQYYKRYPEFLLNSIDSEKLTMFFLQFLASKGDDWDYEFEWRAVTELGGGKLYEFNKDILTGIIFGLRTTESDEKMVMETVKLTGYTNVEFYKAQLKQDEFEIEICRF